MFSIECVLSVWNVSLLDRICSFGSCVLRHGDKLAKKKSSSKKNYTVNARVIAFEIFYK